MILAVRKNNVFKIVFHRNLHVRIRSIYLAVPPDSAFSCVCRRYNLVSPDTGEYFNQRHRCMYNVTSVLRQHCVTAASPAHFHFSIY